MIKPRRTLHVAKTARGGSAFSLHHLVNGLDTRRYNPTVLFYVQEHPHIGHKLAQSGIKTVTLAEQARETSSPPADPAQRREVGAWLRAHLGQRVSEAYFFLKACYQFVRQDAPKIRPIVRVIGENEIDLLHTNTGLRHDKAGIVAARLAGIPCVCHVRMLEGLRPFDKLFARFVDAFIYISTSVAQNYADQGIPAAKGTIIHNAVDLAEFSPPPNGACVRREFGWTDGERLVGVIGRLDWWKGHEHFIEAMAQVVRQIPHARGLIVGEPEHTPKNWAYYQKLQSLTQALGLEDKIVFTGFRDDVPHLLTALDVVVLSSAAPEPFGRVVIEGMAAGKPVVATGAGGVLDIIQHDVNGLLVPPRDPSALAEAILALATDRERAQRLAEAGKSQVRERFTVQKYVTAVQSVYDSILDDAKSG